MDGIVVAYFSVNKTFYIYLLKHDRLKAEHNNAE